MSGQRWTVHTLADRQPVPGQVVLYRLRPVDEFMPATYDGQAWVSGGHRQTARAHHEWVETDTPPPPRVEPRPTTRSVAAASGAHRGVAMSVPERIVALLQDFAPLPLTYDDLVDELGLKRKHVQKEVGKLVKVGRVRRDRGNGDVQLYAISEGRP